jgi:hypothetical protein
MQAPTRPDGQTDVRSFFQRSASHSTQQHESTAARSTSSVMAATGRKRAPLRVKQNAQNTPNRRRATNASHAEIDIENTGA